MGSRYTSRSLRWRRNAGRWEALRWGMAQGLITKNPCDFCKPPKRAAVDKVEEGFDAEMSGYGDAIMDSAIGAPKRREPALSFSVDQLKAMLAAAEEREASHGRP